MHSEGLICRSVVLKSFGGVDQLSYLTRSVDTPEQILLEENCVLGGTQIIINVRACAISDIDIHVREGQYKFLSPKEPIIGYEIAGVVEKVGEDISDSQFQIGDSVVGLLPLDTKFGGYSDYCLAEAHYFVPMPVGLTFEKAAASVVPLLRAYDALYYHANVKQGDFIFISRGAHVMNFALLQLALRSHCHVVTTFSTDEERESLQELLDARKHDPYNDESESSQLRLRILDTRNIPNLKEAVLQETGRLGVDCVVLRGDEPESFIDECLSMMATHSMLLSPSQNIDLNIARCRQMFLKGIKFGFLFEQSWILSTSQQGRYLHMLQESMRRAGEGELLISVGQIYALEKIREAHRKHQLSMNATSILTGRIVVKL